MKNSLFLLFTCVFFLQVSCSKESGNPKPDVQLKEEKLLNQSYGSNSRQKMDVYLPKSRSESTPLVIIIHGGTWIEGDKEDLRFVQESLLKQNIASVNMNYRYASLNHHYDGMMKDVEAVIKTIREKADDWTIRKEKFSMIGYSAGAHLALLYAYGFQKQQEIKTVISIAGPTDLKTLSQDPLENILLASVLVGVSPTEFFTSSKVADASPIFHINRAIPTLLVQGTADEIVPFSQSQTLKDALQTRGVKNKLLILDGGKHDITENPLHVLKTITESTNWIKDHGK